MLKIFKNKYLMSLFLILFVSFSYYIGGGIIDYIKWNNYVKASTGLEDGGKITMVHEPCIIDSPPSDPVVCGISCPLATEAWGSACAGHIQIDVASQKGTVFLAPPVGFVYKGGGTHPVAGMDYLYAGTPATPWVIGIPGPRASRIQKLVNIYNDVKVFIAGKKD